MAKIRIWYDEDGDTLEITTGGKKGYLKDIGDGKVAGVAILNFKKRKNT